MTHGSHRSCLGNLFLATFVALTTRDVSGLPPPAESPNVAALKRKLAAIIQSSGLKDAEIGVDVVAADTGERLFGHNQAKLFAVASNMKLFTTAAALTYLGSEFHYTTVVAVRGAITAQGELQGHVIVHGSGDPNISGRFHENHTLAVLESWADALKNRGIVRVTGDVVADDSLFDREFACPTWPSEQLSHWYCAQTSALSFNDNCIVVCVSPGKVVGSPVTVTVEPATSYVTIVNQCLTTDSRGPHAVSLQRTPETNTIVVGGKCRAGAGSFREFVTVHDPALYQGTVFKETLQRRGVAVTGTVRRPVEGELKREGEQEIVSFSSPLVPCITVANKRSQNLYAEQLLKTMGARLSGEGSFAGGIAVVRNLLERLGFPPCEYQLADGSGLSRRNQLSPVMLTSLLQFMRQSPHWQAFYDSLAISGVDGSLEKRLGTKVARGKVRAKTGSILKASALSGYVETASGKLVAFSVLVNDYRTGIWKARALQDAICEALCQYAG